MPPDNEESIEPGEDVSFPQDGPSSNTSIARLSDSSFTLTVPGTYLVMFEVTVTQSAQLVLTLNGEPLDYTLVGRNAGSSQIVGMALVTTEIATTVLTVRNPDDVGTPLIITPTAGGALPVSAHLIILQIA